MNAPENELQDLLDSLDPTTRTLVAEADLGEQAREFVRSDLGRFMIGAAMQETVEAQAQLARVLPWRRRRIQELQNRIWRSEFFLSLLRELLMSGRAAKGLIEEGENE